MARFNDKFRVNAFRYDLFAEIDEALCALLLSTVEVSGMDVTSFNHGGLAAVVLSAASVGLVSKFEVSYFIMK